MDVEGCQDFVAHFPKKKLFQTQEGESMYIVLHDCVEILHAFPSTETSWLKQCTTTLPDLAAVAENIYDWAIQLSSRNNKRIFWADILAKYVDSVEEVHEC